MTTSFGLPKTAAVLLLCMSLGACGQKEEIPTLNDGSDGNSANSSRMQQGKRIGYLADKDGWRNRVLQFGKNSGAGEFKSRYGAVLGAKSEAERSQLASLGFPSDEVLMRLSRLSFNELQAKANSGDKDALWFLTDQLATGVRALHEAYSSGQLPSDIDDLVLSGARIDVMGLARRTLREVDTPFAAYVYGQAMSDVTYPPRSEAFAATFQEAGERGDPRAVALQEQYLGSHPDLDRTAIESQQRTIQTLLTP